MSKKSEWIIEIRDGIPHLTDRKELIRSRWERDKAMEQLEEHHIPFLCVAPDVVEVVRCADCKYWHEDVANNFTSIPRGGCKLIRGLTNSEFFCAMGERREANDKG